MIRISSSRTTTFVVWPLLTCKSMRIRSNKGVPLPCLYTIYIISLMYSYYRRIWYSSKCPACCWSGSLGHVVGAPPAVFGWCREPCHLLAVADFQSQTCQPGWPSYKRKQDTVMIFCKHGWRRNNCLAYWYFKQPHLNADCIFQQIGLLALRQYLLITWHFYNYQSW